MVCDKGFSTYPVWNASESDLETKSPIVLGVDDFITSSQIILGLRINSAIKAVKDHFKILYCITFKSYEHQCI